MVPTILIIDDDTEFASDLAALLSPDFAIRSATSGEEGLGAIASDAPDAVVLDLMLEGGRNGLEILLSIKKLDPSLPVIMATDYPSPETEAEALRRGALYYVRKAAGRTEVISKLLKCDEVCQAIRERDRLRREVSAVHGLFLSSSSSVMGVLEATVDRIAAAPNTTVLITGESGTGKSLLAREIHARSPRQGQCFLRINMATLTDGTAPSELFGHVRGAYTGAMSDRKGHFETAKGGTIFLDEIGDLSLKLQGQLLHTVEEREVIPLGCSTPRQVDVRVIAATNRDLLRMVKEGVFRTDLLERLCVITVKVPPLREHPEDIPDLARYFLGRFAAEMRFPRVALCPDTLDRLQKHAWRRNNVRELRNSIERALVLHGDRGELEPDAFDLFDDEPPIGFDYNKEKERAVRAFQQRFFGRTFAALGSSLMHHRPEDTKRVADLTGIPPHTVRRILKELS